MIKMLISVWVLFSVVTELWLFFNCCKCHSVSCVLQVTLCDHEPGGTEAVSRRCNSQLSGSVSCGWQWHFRIPAKTSQCKVKEISLNLVKFVP